MKEILKVGVWDDGTDVQWAVLKDVDTMVAT